MIIVAVYLARPWDFFCGILLLLRLSLNVSTGLDEAFCRKREILTRDELPH